MNHYKLLETSYINGALRHEGTVVQFNDDPSKGGLTPGSNMVACDEDGNEVKAPKTPKPSKPAKGKETAADDLA